MFGRAVRERRQDLELTLEEASTAIGISRSHLNLIELGKSTGISHDSAARTAAGIGCDGALLALLPAVDAGSSADQAVRSQDMRRAEFNKAVVAISASLLLDPERLIGTRSVDAAVLEDLESLTAEFARRQHHGRPETILGPVRAHLHHLLDLEGASVAPNLQPRLAHVTAETAAIAGWVAFRGQGDLVTAHAQLALGRQYAREAGDDALLAQLLAASSSFCSSIDIPRDGEIEGSPLALSMLRAAQRKAGSNSPSLQGWLAVRIAEEQALLGEARRARALLTRAEKSVPSGHGDGQVGLFIIWDQTRFPGWAGKALLLLGDPAAADLLEQALALTNAPHPRLGVLVDLTVARARRGDVDHAGALLVEATQLAVERGIDKFARWRLREGRAALPAAQQDAFDRHLQAIA